MLISIKSSTLAALVLFIFVAHLDSSDAKVHIRRHKSQSKDDNHGGSGKPSTGNVHYHDDHGNAQKGDPQQGCNGGKKSCNGTSHGGSIPSIPSSHCSSKIPSIAGVSASDQPIRLSGGMTHDCHNQLLRNSAGPVFYVTGSATISNCFFDQTGTLDTIEIVGDGTVNINNVFILSVGDDAISIKGGMKVTINNGVCMNAPNKCVQHDGTGAVNVNKFCFWHVHIGVKSCGNCKENARAPPRILTLDSISIDPTVTTLCAANINGGDHCILTNVDGKPGESLCTVYDGIADPGRMPQQKSKNVRNKQCSF